MGVTAKEKKGGSENRYKNSGADAADAAKDGAADTAAGMDVKN